MVRPPEPGPNHRRARLSARDVAVYFPQGVHVRLPWQSDRSDEFLTLAALDSTPLDAAEAEAFMEQVEP